MIWKQRNFNHNLSNRVKPHRYCSTSKSQKINDTHFWNWLTFNGIYRSSMHKEKYLWKLEKLSFLRGMIWTDSSILIHVSNTSESEVRITRFHHLSIKLIASKFIQIFQLLDLVQVAYLSSSDGQNRKKSIFKNKNGLINCLI